MKDFFRNNGVLILIAAILLALVTAVVSALLGGGANLLGYYMYHGGINPEGKETNLQESRVTGYNNDLPVKSYDFQTCIRESGEVNESYFVFTYIFL